MERIHHDTIRGPVVQYEGRGHPVPTPSLSWQSMSREMDEREGEGRIFCWYPVSFSQTLRGHKYRTNRTSVNRSTVFHD